VNIAISSYHFLIRCPVLLKIDLQAVANYFLNLGLQALALGKNNVIQFVCLYFFFSGGGGAGAS